jgi:hypothetical protein
VYATFIPIARRAAMAFRCVPVRECHLLSRELRRTQAPLGRIRRCESGCAARRRPVIG